MPCLVQFSVAAMPAKMPYLNTPRLIQEAYIQLKGVMHRLQPSLSYFPCLSILEDRLITTQSLDQRSSRALIHQSARGRSSFPSGKVPALIP